MTDASVYRCRTRRRPHARLSRAHADELKFDPDAAKTRHRDNATEAVAARLRDASPISQRLFSVALVDPVYGLFYALAEWG